MQGISVFAHDAGITGGEVGAFAHVAGNATPRGSF